MSAPDKDSKSLPPGTAAHKGEQIVKAVSNLSEQYD
jgi:hypothetical protein